MVQRSSIADRYVGDMTVQVISATPHLHNPYAIEEWFQDKVELIALSPTPREKMSRDYMNKIIAEIHEAIEKISFSSRVFFLMTGHPFFNAVALYALKRKLGETPFIILVWEGETYHAWGSNFALEYPDLLSY